MALGCGSDSAAERLVLALGDGGGVLLVDTTCEATCGGDDQIAVRIDYPDRQYVDDEVIELTQYRVDYDVRLVPGDIQYFAGMLGVSLAPGSGTTVTLTVAGTEQRKYVREHIDDEIVAGTATLMLAGYDWDNAQVFVEREFDIRFGDLALGDTAAGTAGSGGEADASVP